MLMDLGKHLKYINSCIKKFCSENTFTRNQDSLIKHFLNASQNVLDKEQNGNLINIIYSHFHSEQPNVKYYIRNILYYSKRILEDLDKIER